MPALTACGASTPPPSRAILQSDLDQTLKAARERADPGHRRHTVKLHTRRYRRTYHLTLTPPRPTTATATATLKLLPSTSTTQYAKICWNIKSHDLRHPTQLQIRRGRLTYLTLNPQYTPKGCQPAANQLLRAITRAPSRYSLTITTLHAPRGVLRARL